MSQRSPYAGSVRGRVRAQWLLAVTVLAATAWAVAQQLQLPVWVRIIASAAAAGIPVLVLELRERRYQDDEKANDCRQHLHKYSLTSGIPRIRAIRDVTDFNVTPSRSHRGLSRNAQPPYVRRDLDDKLEQLLREEQFVLIVGDSKAGKTRMAVEAVRRLFPDRLMVYPHSAESLVAILNANIVLNDSIVWVDELQDYLEKNALARLLEVVTNADPSANTSIVGTIRENVYREHTPHDSLESAHWRTLQRACLVRLERMFSEAEQERAAEIYRDPQLLAALKSYGLAEYLAAGPVLVDRLEGGMVTERLGSMLVWLAIDWERTGIGKPMPLDALNRLIPPYADTFGLGQPTKQELHKALRWAQQPVYARSALLSNTGGGLTVYDYVHDHVLGSAANVVPDPTWRAALGAATTSEDFSGIGIAAYMEQRADVALEALAQAAALVGANTVDPGGVVFNYATLLRSLNRDDLAEAAFRRAAGYGQVEAAFIAGNLVLGRDGRGEAEKYYRQAAQGGHGDAAYSLGLLLAEDSPDEATRWLIAASDVGIAHAGYVVGRMLQERGRLDEAERHFRQSSDGQDIEGTFALGMLLQATEPDEALPLLRAAGEMGHGKAASAAARMLHDRGDFAEAARFVRMAESGSELSAALALLRPTRRSVARRSRLGHGGTRMRQSADVVQAALMLKVDTAELTTEELKVLAQRAVLAADGGQMTDTLPPELLAVVREVAVRTLGVRMGKDDLTLATALHLGAIAEVDDSRDVELLVLVAACLSPLYGKANVAVPDDRAARRFTERVRPVLEALGISVGCVLDDMDLQLRRSEYSAQVTVASFATLVFDYLRDGMSWTTNDTVGNQHDCLFVLDADEAMLDTPWHDFTITHPDHESPRWYLEFAKLAANLQPDQHYSVLVEDSRVDVTEEGIDQVEDELGIDNLYDPPNASLILYLEQALQAKELYRRGLDYLVEDGRIVYLNRTTGRVQPTRTYNDGMQQAIEAKEGVDVRPRAGISAQIVRWSYLNLHHRVGGLIRSGPTAARRLKLLYGLDQVSVADRAGRAPRQPVDELYRTDEGRLAALLELVHARQQSGQPVLVDTFSDELSRRISDALTALHVNHCLVTLEGGFDEVSVLQGAGARGAVTVMTNSYSAHGPVPLGGPTTSAAERDEVAALGGLLVVGCGRRTERRLDEMVANHARAGGSAGQVVFLLSTSDALFDGAPVQRATLGIEGPFTGQMISWSIVQRQSMFEELKVRSARRQMEYAKVFEEQRRHFYDLRATVLVASDAHLEARTAKTLNDVIARYVSQRALMNDDTLDALWDALSTLFPISIDWRTIPLVRGRRSMAVVKNAVLADARRAYAARAAEICAMAGQRAMHELERRIYLSVIDRSWREYMVDLSDVRKSLGILSMGGLDPLVEYRRQTAERSADLIANIEETTIAFVFNLTVEVVHHSDATSAIEGGVADAEVGRSESATRT